LFISFRNARVGASSKVITGTERGPSAGQYDNSDLTVFVSLFEGYIQVIKQLMIERVSLFRSIHNNPGNTVLDFVDNRFQLHDSPSLLSLFFLTMLVLRAMSHGGLEFSPLMRVCQYHKVEQSNEGKYRFEDHI